jgi:hypothetical protein
MKQINHNSKKFSLSGKLNRHLSFDDVSNLPGPGSYTNRSVEIKPSGKYYLSTYKNSLVSSFGNYKSKRFDYQNNTMLTPGPGKYSYFDSFKGSGVSLVSKFKSSLGRSFSGRIDCDRKNESIFIIINRPRTRKL